MEELVRSDAEFVNRTIFYFPLWFDDLNRFSDALAAETDWREAPRGAAEKDGGASWNEWDEVYLLRYAKRIASDRDSFRAFELDVGALKGRIDIPDPRMALTRARLSCFGTGVGFLGLVVEYRGVTAGEGAEHVAVIELKQWADSGPTSRADVVTAFTGGAERAVCHPCYQAYSYAMLLRNLQEGAGDVQIHPCVFLHNYREENRAHIDSPLYRDALEAAPLFLQDDAEKLRAYLASFLRRPPRRNIPEAFDKGRFKPAKALQDALPDMLRGSDEFLLIDDQKVAYETVRKLTENAVRGGADGEKSVVIVTGGPGTGKSVVAIRLLCDLIEAGYGANYVTKNAAPRNVYFEKLRGEKYRLNYIKSLFKSSDAFWNAPKDSVDCILADEAHRLKKKSMIYHGENQIKELIQAARVCVFFIDEDQRITTHDIGSVAEIRRWAEFCGAKVYDGLELASQFRCGGSDGYLNYLDHLLGIRETANTTFEYNYELRLFNSPTAMREALREKNAVNNKARMIAGYCFEWQSEKNPSGDVYDIVLEDGFRAKWNFSDSVFAIAPDSFEQVGCIHTTQGLEFEYCGIIVGPDLLYRDGRVVTVPSAEAVSDRSSGIRGCKDPALADRLIRNTYKTLLSRGQKGCYVYCVDKALLHYMSETFGVPIE